MKKIIKHYPMTGRLIFLPETSACGSKDKKRETEDG
jgi:hypothetical protein